MKKIKNLFKKNTAIYKIIAVQNCGETVYLIKRRTSWWNWDYVYDVIQIGFDARSVQYEAFYNNIQAAEARVQAEMENDKKHKSVSKTVKIFYTEDI